jgi:hypothetical protein
MKGVEKQKMSIVIMQGGIISRIRDIIKSFISMLGIEIEPEVKIEYITEYIPYRGLDYYLIAALAGIFGLCLIISIMKYKNLIAEINEHSYVSKKDREKR